jgi:nucleotidyltransferase substrate binding protein (TIGR01987 family)
MSHQNDIRWVQRFNNYSRALQKLNEIVNYIRFQLEEEKQQEAVLKDIFKQGVIQSFEYTHELAWNVMKDYAKYQGNNDIGGSRDATREALQLSLIENGEVWMEMIRSRNKTSHTYNEEVANKIFNKVLTEYQPAFIKFQNKMEEKQPFS